MKKTIKTDSIIAVKNVIESSEWYEKLFDCNCSHEDDSFRILTDDDGNVILCLHKWNEDNHPTMTDENITAGNGLILYFRVSNFDEIRGNAEKLEAKIEDEIHENINSKHQEFSLRDLDDYYLTITQYHDYGYGLK